MLKNQKYLKKLSKYDRIIIYGAGKIGSRVADILKESGNLDRVVCFAVSDSPAEGAVLRDLPVKSIYSLREEYQHAIFLLAVNSKIMPEIEAKVRVLKIRHYMDAKKLYLESYQKSQIGLMARKIRDALYVTNETGVFVPWKQGKKAAHVTYCLAPNAGDVMLSACVRDFLKFPRWNIIDVAAEVEDKTIQEINAADILIIGGGGLFLPDSNPNKISGWQWAVSKEQISNVKVPVIIFSVGFNYFKEQHISALFIESIHSLVMHAAFVGLRNMGSVRAIRDILTDERLREKVVYQPCTTTLISKMYGFEKKNNGKRIGVNIAFDRRERRFGKDEAAILKQVAKAVCKMKEMGYQITYIAHSDEDLNFLGYLDAENVNYKVKNLTNKLPGEVVRCYKKMDLVMGMRGHAQMIPFGVGCRIISLGTHDKMRWFLEDIHALDWYIDLNGDIDNIENNILDVFRRVNVDDGALTDKRIKEAQDMLWKISCRNRERILERVSG